jgi:predicted 3-demethylubiquinone-9 3-methyltransferase (glyoxalase superfamily)
MQKITPYFWFDNQAEEAMKFYVSTFKNSKVLSVNRAGGDDAPVMMCVFELEGQQFYALNGGPVFKFNEAISFLVDCKTQEEVDALWDKLTADGGEPGNCGWLKDKYGVSWQIIPEALTRLMSDPNPAKAGAVMQAMLKMNKIETAKLQEAYDQA